MVTIYFARHAEASNPRGILYGRLPGIDLSETGRRQAAEMAAALGNIPLEAIYCSPLLRARRTALALAAAHPNIPLRFSSLLLENRHPYEGRAHADVTALGDRVYDPEILGQTGETIQQIQGRMVRFLRRAAAEHQDGIIASIGHADPLAVLRAALLTKPMVVGSLRSEAPPPAAIFRVDYEPDGYSSLEWFWKPASAEHQGREQKQELVVNGGLSAA